MLPGNSCSERRPRRKPPFGMQRAGTILKGFPLLKLPLPDMPDKGCRTLRVAGLWSSERQTVHVDGSGLQLVTAAWQPSSAAGLDACMGRRRPCRPSSLHGRHAWSKLIDVDNKLPACCQRSFQWSCMDGCGEKPVPVAAKPGAKAVVQAQLP